MTTPTGYVTACLGICLLTYAGTAVKAQSSPNVILEWAKSTPLPEPRAGYSAGVVGGKLVIAGGTYWDGTVGHWTKKHYTASTHAFDPVAQRWERLPDLPIALGYAASTVVGGRLFVLGGYTGSNVSRKIFTLGKSRGRYIWSVFGEMSVDRVFAAAVTVGRSIYLVGGTTSLEAFDEAGTCCATHTVTNSMMTLDTDFPAKGWRQVAPIPGRGRWLPAATSDGKAIWIFGGMLQSESTDPVTNFREVLKFDLAQESWSVMPPLPQAIVDAQPLCSLKMGDRIFLFTALKTVWQLEPGTGRYSETTPMPEAVAVDQFFWLHDRIIGAGGESQVDGPRRRSEWTFVARIVSGK